MWSLGPQGLVTCRQDVRVTTQFVVSVLAHVEDGEAIKLGMRILARELAKKLPAGVPVESVLTDITVDGGPSDNTLQEAWPGVRVWRDVQHVKANAKESRRKTAPDVKRYTSDLISSTVDLPSLVEFSAPWEFWTRKLADAEEVGESKYVTTTILNRVADGLWDAPWRCGIGNLSKLGYHGYRQNATERGQRRIKDTMPTGYATQTAGEAIRQHCMSMGAMAGANIDHVLDELPPGPLPFLIDSPVPKSSTRTPALAVPNGAPEDEVGRQHKRVTAKRIHDHYVQAGGESRRDLTYMEEVVDISFIIAGTAVRAKKIVVMPRYDLRLAAKDPSGMSRCVKVTVATTVPELWAAVGEYTIERHMHLRFSFTTLIVTESKAARLSETWVNRLAAVGRPFCRGDQALCGI